MSPRAKHEYVEAVVKRYKRSSRINKSRILDELCVNCGFHRKHAIRLLRKLTRRRRPKPRRSGPKPIYSRDEILNPIKKIWLAANLPCSKRLKAILPLWLPGYQSLQGPLSPDILQLLLRISAATIDRLLKPIRVRYQHRGRCTTKPGTLLRHQIPIATEQWNQTKPGFVEADTVAHCGESMAGQFSYTIDCVDIATGWSEQRAVWGRGETDVLLQIRHIEKSLPFPLLGFDCDNGSEFLNYHLLRHFRNRSTPVSFTRSRAYHKDDNAHVEQKNWTHVRQWIGYDRLDNPRVVSLLNDLYCNEWRLFQNFFCPSVKLLSKNRIGSKTIKCHDSPKTPCQRVIESPYTSDDVKKDLTIKARSLNPFLLREIIETKLKKIFQCCYKQNICSQRSVMTRFGNI
jgi:hypothetical protein